MLKIKQNGKTLLINTKLITYVATVIDWERVANTYKILIRFTKDNDLLIPFYTKDEQEQFLNELIDDMNKE